MVNKNAIRIILTIILILTSIHFVIASGGRRNGTAGAQELLIPVGARGIALSGSYIAGLEGIEAIYYNPAGLGLSESKAEVVFSYMNYIADINFSYAAVAVNMQNFGSLALTMRTLDFGDIPVTTTDRPEGTGTFFSPNYTTVGLTYSNFLTDRICAGVSFNLVNETIMNCSATGLSIDAGIQYNNVGSINGLKMGVVIRNFGSPMKYDGADLLTDATDADSKREEQFYKVDAAEFELPSQFELGLAYERNLSEEYSVIITTAFQNNNFSNDEYKIGGEFGFRDMVFLRGGYSYIGEAIDNEDENIFGPTLGAGVNLTAGVNITIDYAYRIVNNFFDNNQVFSIKIAF